MNIIETNLKFGALSTRKLTKRAILHHAEASNTSTNTNASSKWTILPDRNRLHFAG